MSGDETGGALSAILTFRPLAAADEVVMAGGGVSDGEETDHHAAEPEDDERDLVVCVPGDHHDGCLQHQLQGGLGQHAEAGQYSGPGEVLELEKVVLSFVELIRMPYDQ